MSVCVKKKHGRTVENYRCLGYYGICLVDVNLLGGKPGVSEKKATAKKIQESLHKEIKELRHKIKDMQALQDIKERSREREYRLKYKKMLDKMANPILIYDAVTFRFVSCNQAAVDNYGYTQDEFKEITPFELHQPDDFQRVREIVEKPTGQTETFTHLTRDRYQLIVKIKSQPIHFDGQPSWMWVIDDLTRQRVMEQELDRHRHKLEEMVNERTIEVLLANKQLKQEIKERQKIEQAILESEKKFRDLIEKSRDGIILADEKGTIIEWNQGQEKIYGTKRAEVMGRKIWEVQFQHEPENKRDIDNLEKTQNLWEEFYETGKNPFDDELQYKEIQRSDGGTRSVQQLHFAIETESGVMIACTTRDISPRVALEKEVAQSRKMEAMGAVAGEIAHDFNNILGAILGYTELAIRKSGKSSPTVKYMEHVRSASRRATDLVKQILTFSRKDDEKKEKEPVLIRSVVNETFKLIRTSLPSTVEIAARIEAENTFIMAHSSRIHQVIMNLCTNAGHAMKKKGGTLGVRLKDEHIEPGTLKGLKEGPYVRLTISDTGHGIKPELLEKIYEPFFTTKKEGEGTGMGLAVVHGIVEAHGGHISVFSQPGQGTAFSILFPVVVDVIHKIAAKGESIPGGSEHILLAEDDPPLAQAEQSLLMELGYQVTKCNSGVEAFEIFQKIPDRFNILITDMVMPRMTGDELIKKIRETRPDIPVILCTGYSKLMTQQKVKDIGNCHLIMKPIDLGTIARLIRHLLDET